MLDLEPKSFTEKVRPVNASTWPHRKNNEFSMTSTNTMASLVQAQPFWGKHCHIPFLESCTFNRGKLKCYAQLLVLP